MSEINENHSLWRDRDVFVTGATGLLGNSLVSELIAVGARVTCLVRDWVPDSNFYRLGLDRNVRCIDGDVQDRSLLERILGEYETETVFHLAAQTIVGIANRNPVSTFETNIMGTWNLLEACRRSPRVKQIVVASSDKAYGDQEQLPYDETMPLKGTYPYDVSKSCADLICRTYSATYNLPVCVTRCGNFYGAGDLNWNRVVPGTIRSVIRGERPIIRSDGTYVRDYFYVDDGAKAYIHLAEQMAAKPEILGESFNFSNEIQLTVFQVVEKILGLMGKSSELPPIVRGEGAHEILRQYLSAEKARTMLGWSPAYTLDEGLIETIRWYEEFLADQDRDRHSSPERRLTMGQ
jgi:CDP-glucose 4,6-dehydratase